MALHSVIAFARWGLVKDRDALLAFYDFPAEQWKHLRTTNVIESSFATVRHRTVRSKARTRPRWP
jgi:transposase-like protein